MRSGEPLPLWPILGRSPARGTPRRAQPRIRAGDRLLDVGAAQAEGSEASMIQRFDPRLVKDTARCLGELLREEGDVRPPQDEASRQRLLSGLSRQAEPEETLPPLAPQFQSQVFHLARISQGEDGSGVEHPLQPHRLPLIREHNSLIGSARNNVQQGQGAGLPLQASGGLPKIDVCSYGESHAKQREHPPT